MNSASRLPLPPSFRSSPVVAVLRAAHALDYSPVIEALVDGGVHHVEVTLSTPGTLDAVPQLIERFGSAARIGIGTITDPVQARRAIDTGCSYLVTPTTNAAIIDVAVRARLPVFPGGFTPTELQFGWSLGATAVKVFPASQLGHGYVADLRGPFPGIELIPSGGVTVDGALAWLNAGACAVSLGGPLLQDALKGGDLADLTRRARELSTRVEAAGFGGAR